MCKKSGKYAVTVKSENGKAFNNIRIVVKVKQNNHAKILIHKLLYSIEILIGGRSYDKIHGHSIEVLQQLFKLTNTQNNDEIIINIPFGISTKNNIIFLDLLENHDVRIVVDFHNIYEIEYANIVASFYTCNHDILLNEQLLKYHNNNSSCCALKYLHMFKQCQTYEFQFDTKMISEHILNFGFENHNKYYKCN